MELINCFESLITALMKAQEYSVSHENYVLFVEGYNAQKFRVVLARPMSEHIRVEGYSMLIFGRDND